MYHFTSMDVKRIVVINENSDPTIAEIVQRLFRGFREGVPVPIFKDEMRRIGLINPYYVVDEELLSKRGVTALKSFNGSIYYAHCNRVYASEDLIDF